MRPLDALPLAVALSVILAGCGDFTGEDGPDIVTGTGSSGGNPLSFDFETEDSERFDDVVWESPVLHIGSRRFAFEDTAGQCVFDDEAEVFVEDFAFDRSRRLDIEPPNPCAFELNPAEGESLVSVRATVRGRSLDLSFGRVTAIAVNILRPELLSISQEIVVIFEVDKLLEGIDVQGLLDRLDLLSDLSDEDRLALRDQAVANLAEAVTIYLDPTPGDGVLLPEERVEANVLATFEVFFSDEG